MRQSFLFLSLIILVLEVYIYRAFKTLVKNKTGRIVYLAINAIAYITFFSAYFTLDKNNPDSSRLQLVSAIFFVFILPKLLILVFLLVDDILRLIQFGIQKLRKEKKHYPSRRKFLVVAGFGVFSALSLALLDGITFGKYRHWVRKVKISIPNLGSAFKGYKILQISDVHSGSFSSPEKLQDAIDLINAQDADLVLFTGDMVNTKAEEFRPFIELFKSIKSKDGKYSVLGNHDYGKYHDWPTPQDEINNLNQLIAYEKEAGFTMLRNENISIDKNGDKLYLVGVENWGRHPFPQFGDLDKATENLSPNDPKILMSHDPTHFDEIVKKHPSNIYLTLSGHTHGMQFGLDLKNIRWSPSQYIYPKWADLYESEGKLLYVNRGFGVLGFPGRVGINPEITVFEIQ